VIVFVPAVIAVATPVALPIVTRDVLLTHVPPVPLMLYVVLLPMHNVVAPLIVPGDALTVTTLVVEQPPTV
jgi:hypothetical protein